MIATTFCAGLRAIADAADLNRLDACRRSVDDRGQAGELSAAAVSILVDACRERAVELFDLDRVEAVAAPVVVASAPAPAAGVVDGDCNATIAQAAEREFDDSGTVLLLTLTADVAGEPVEVRCRFDAAREIPRKAMFRAAGLPAGAAVEQLIGKSVRVTLGTWSPPAGGSPRAVVRRWLSPAAPAPAAPRASVIKGNTAQPPKHSRPQWESDSDIPF